MLHLVALIAAALAGSAASVQPRFHPGEKHELDVMYLGIPGLQVTLEVLPTAELNSRKVFHFRAHATSSKLVSLFYSVDDRVESWFDQQELRSHKLKLEQRHSKFSRSAEEIYDTARNETIFVNKVEKKGESPRNERKVFPLSDRTTQDTFSAFYYLRTLPLEVGASYIVPVTSEGETMKVKATVTGVEKLEIRRRKREAIAIKLEKLDAAGNPMSGDNRVYLSNDEHRSLLEVNVKTRMGVVVAQLDTYSAGKP